MFDLLRAGLLFATISLSFGLTYRLGYLNLAHGDIIVLGGLVMWKVYTGLSGSISSVALFPLLLGTTAAILISALCCLIIHLFILEPLLLRSLRMPQILASLGCSLVLASLCVIVFGIDSRNLPIPQTIIKFHNSALKNSDIFLFFSFILGGGIIWLLRRWRLMYKAVANNRALAGLWGVQLGPLSWSAALLSGASAGLIGVEFVLADKVQPGVGMERLLLVFAGMVVGKPWGLTGMVCSSLVTGMVFYVLSANISPWLATVGVLLLVGIALLIRDFLVQHQNSLKISQNV